MSNLGIIKRSGNSRVWTRLSEIDGLNGTFFLRDASGNTTTVIGENDLKMQQEFAVSRLQERNDLANVFFFLTRRSHFLLCWFSEGFLKYQLQTVGSNGLQALLTSHLSV